MRAKKFADNEVIREHTKSLNKDAYSSEFRNSGPLVANVNGEYRVDNSFRHCITYGTTGSGKSRSGSITETMNALRAGESVVVLDPKGEHMEILIDHVPDNYKKVVIDFQNLANSDHVNLLSYIVYMLKSSEDYDRSIGSFLFESFLDSFMKGNSKNLDFWQNAGKTLIRGYFYLMVSCVKQSDINLVSLYRLMNGISSVIPGADFNRRTMSGNVMRPEIIALSVATSLSDDCPYKGIAVENLSIVANYNEKVMRDTLAVSTAAITKLVGTGDMREFHQNSTFDIKDVDGKTPMAIFVILPIDTHAYDLLAGFIVNQLAQQFFRVARRSPNRCLPVRVNFVLEEFGTIGKTVGLIKELVTAGRSYGIRIHIILQSYSQLVFLYGDAVANTIASNCGTTIFYRTIDPATYNHYGKICGMRRVSCGPYLLDEPMITQDSLTSLDMFQAMVMIDDTIFVSRLPQYTEVYSELN